MLKLKWYIIHIDVFHNETLLNEFTAMWQFMANHYKSVDYIAGYEILSEPRTKNAGINQTDVLNFYKHVTNAIREYDTETPIIIGPAPYYKIWMYNSSIINFNDNKTIYTADLFIPQCYIESDSSSSYTYPGYYVCSDIYPGFTCSGTGNVPPCFCPGEPNEELYFNKSFIFENLLNEFLISSIRDEYNVPVYVNQWGVERQVPENHGRLDYFRDLVSLFTEYGIHSSYWIWKYDGSDYSWNGYEMVHNFTSNGTVAVNKQQTDIMNQIW